MNSLRDIRLLLGWTIKNLSEKAQVSRSIVSRVENDKAVHRDYMFSIIAAIENEVEMATPLPIRKEQKQERIDLKEYFPNLSRSQIKSLFTEEWLRNNVKGYEKQGLRNEDDFIAFKDVADRFSEILTKLQYSSNKKRIKTREDIIGDIGLGVKAGRLWRALSYTKKYMKSLSENERKKYFGGEFKPKYNPKACKLFDMFDEVNNTKGLYATSGGEFLVKELGYFLDYINHDLKLIIEWDEEHHYDNNGNLRKDDIDRQNKVQKYFPHYEFIRIREKDFEEYLFPEDEAS